MNSFAARRASGQTLGLMWLVVAPLALVALLALPLVALVSRASPAALLARLADPVVLDALRLSLVTCLASTLLVIVLGLPVAYLLAMREFPGRRALELIVELPMVLPPTVAGFALLMAFGRAGLLGGALRAAGITLPFTTLGTVIAQVFMSAPFFILAARTGFASVDRRLLDAASTLRATELDVAVRVLLPLSRRALIAGAAMSAARALGEFGASITFAGNLRGVTQTMPIAVYVAMQSDLDTAVVLSVLLVVMAGALLVALRALPAGGAMRPGLALDRVR